MLAAGGPAAAKLLAQPAPADRVAGGTAVVLLVVAALALIAGGRREPAVSEPNVAEPAPALETV